MTPEDIRELHCIMPIENLESVMEHGILSHELASRLEHVDVSMSEVQERRDRIRVPNGLRLHQYANLYFHARNPMLFKRKEEAENLSILSVSTKVLTINGVVITDRNAASSWVRFLSPSQLNLLELEQIYARYWTHPGDEIAQMHHKSQKCAEVLVPSSIPSEYIHGAYVVSKTSMAKVKASGFPRGIRIKPDLFFR